MVLAMRLAEAGIDVVLTSGRQEGVPLRPGRARFDYDVVHTNSEFHDQDSDHEPQVVRLDLRGR